MSKTGWKLADDVLEVVTTGFPFCVFKATAGAHLFTRGATLPGAALVLLGAVDLAINVGNLAALTTVRHRVTNACTLSMVSRRLRLFPGTANRYLADFGNSLDVFLSFSLVAFMVGLGRIGSMPPLHVALWNAAVVLNVLGAGLSRVEASLRHMH